MTGLIVTIAHPAPCLHRPRGARVPRPGLARIETPVRLPRAGPRDPRPVAVVAGAVDDVVLHAHAGRLWIPVPGGAAALAAHLADALRAPPYVLAQALVATPAQPRSPGAWDGRGLRGDALGEVVDDGTEAARAALSSFVERDLLLAGEDAYVRCAGPLMAAEPPPLHPSKAVLAFPRWEATHPLRPLFRLDRADEARAYHLSSGQALPGAWEAWDGGCRVREAIAAAIPPGHLRDDDVATYLNAAPGIALGCSAAQAGALERAGGEAVGRMRAERARLAGYALRGEVSGIGPEEAEALLEAVRSYAGTLAAGPSVPRRYVLGEIMDYLARVAVPRWRAEAPVADEDAAALEGLGPRP